MGLNQIQMPPVALWIRLQTSESNELPKHTQKYSNNASPHFKLFIVTTSVCQSSAADGPYMTDEIYRKLYVGHTSNGHVVLLRWHLSILTWIFQILNTILCQLILISGQYKSCQQIIYGFYGSCLCSKHFFNPEYMLVLQTKLLPAQKKASSSVFIPG